MRNLAVLGTQWGDEGKGKIVDLLCEDYDVVARYQGGHNAGHTVKFGDEHFALRLIPSGILHPSKLCILGNGMVIDPEALLHEIESLRGLGVTIDDNLKISESAHVILPYHKAVALAREEAAGRTKLVDDYTRYGEVLAPRITNATVLINAQIRAGKRVMFEGAQGTMLDIDHGTYPFVTSSNTVAGGICTGLGVAPKHIHRVLGVVKAYTTRVGGGAFPTELEGDPHGEHLRGRGNELGTVTGRPRRTGWLDLPVVRPSAMLNGLDELALTKLDVLDDFDEIPVCTGYNVRGEHWRTFPAFAVAHHDYKPEYRVMKGWKTSTAGVTSFEELPPAAKDYVKFIEDETECPAAIISTGPRREETIVRNAAVSAAG